VQLVDLEPDGSRFQIRYKDCRDRLELRKTLHPLGVARRVPKFHRAGADESACKLNPPNFSKNQLGWCLPRWPVAFERIAKAGFAYPSVSPKLMPHVMPRVHSAIA